MPNVTFDKRYLMELIRGEVEDRLLAEEAQKMGVEVEAITDSEVKLAITANRPDLLDVVGFARAFRNFTHKAEKFKYSPGHESRISVKVAEGTPESMPFIACIVARGLRLTDESLKGLLNFSDKFCEAYGRRRTKLAMGIYDLLKIGDTLSYSAYDGTRFAPLGHRKDMALEEILTDTEQGRQYGGSFKKEQLAMLKDGKEVLALIPIVNSERTKITARTTDLLIDITGVNRHAVEGSASLFAASLEDMGAEIQTVKISYPSGDFSLPSQEERFLFIPVKVIEAQIGIKIGFNNIISLANKMGYEAVLVGNKIKFRLPPYRLDILNDQDVIEDIAIAYGYAYIPGVPAQATQQGRLEDRSAVNERASSAMVGMGFTEAMNTYLTNEEDNFTKMLCSSKPAEYVKLSGSKTNTITMLRTCILPFLLKNLGASAHESMPQALFEADMVFRMAGKVPLEEHHLACVKAGPKTNFNEMKSIAESLLMRLGIEYRISESTHRHFIPGRGAKIICKGGEIGSFGEISPEVLSNFGIEEPCIALEIRI